MNKFKIGDKVIDKENNILTIANIIMASSTFKIKYTVEENINVYEEEELKFYIEKNKDSLKASDDLNDTINLMISDNYKDRFIAEYYQTKIRYNKLHKMLIKHQAGTLGFTPDSPIWLLESQEESMRSYLRYLELRAEYEKIEL